MSADHCQLAGPVRLPCSSASPGGRVSHSGGVQPRPHRDPHGSLLEPFPSGEFCLAASTLSHPSSPECDLSLWVCETAMFLTRSPPHSSSGRGRWLEGLCSPRGLLPFSQDQLKSRLRRFVPSSSHSWSEGWSVFFRDGQTMDFSSNQACYQFLHVSFVRHSYGCSRAVGGCCPTLRAEIRGCAKLHGRRAQGVYDLACTERASSLFSDS